MTESHTFAGITFEGRRQVGEILQELERQKAKRKDVVVRSDRIEAVVRDKEFLFKVTTPKETCLVPVTRRVHVQVAQTMGLRMTDRYYKWLAYGSQQPSEEKLRKGEHDPRRNWKLWAQAINDYLHTEKTHRLVRMSETPKGQPYMRAFLSDKYKIIPNADFFYAVVEKLQEVKAEVWHARLSEDKFYGYAVAPGISEQVNTDRPFDPGDGWQSRWYGEKGDVVNAALAFGNSETGEGGIFLSQAILRRVCVNYCVWHDLVSTTHVGKRQGTDVMLSQETLEKQNEVFFMKISDITRGTFQPEKFQEIVDAMTGATREHIVDPDKAAEALMIVYDLGEVRRNAIRNLFVKEGDASRYGLANAVTQVAHHDDIDPETGFGLERLGTELIRMKSMDQLYKKAEAKKDKTEEEVEAPPLSVAVDA